MEVDGTHLRKSDGISFAMSRNTERYGPFFPAAITAVVIAVFASEAESFSRFISVGTMTLGVVVAGFTATQRNMLMSMGGTKVLRFAATTGYYRDVRDYLAWCIYAALFVVVVSGAGIFVNCNSWAWSLWLALWVGSVVLVLGFMVRNEILMSRIFTHFIKEQISRESQISPARLPKVK